MPVAAICYCSASVFSYLPPLFLPPSLPPSLSTSITLLPFIVSLPVLFFSIHFPPFFIFSSAYSFPPPQSPTPSLSLSISSFCSSPSFPLVLIPTIHHLSPHKTHLSPHHICLCTHSSWPPSSLSYSRLPSLVCKEEGTFLKVLTPIRTSASPIPPFSCSAIPFFFL